ncbi:O-acyltransferase, WSD1, C-terminal [Cynara cardunculus var. scolymus]|uniref:O-acyltransferase, WSD1, C-terminal n=1 Tax=Cynara cardunculus var. scolymus TaxID=59895 RepID=A0A103YKM3_CYNCS|nr:O-acyltransferase, WSD1, C-terminal [Cynara cardunculus var. scolymus]
MRNDEPLTPAGRLFMQPATHQIINCAFGLERSVGIDEARIVLSDSLMIEHPRFCSLLVTDDYGRHYWRKTEINIDRHIILHSDPVSEAVNDEAATNDYVADLAVSSPLSTDKPLWEIHILSAHKSVILRFHHALGDGISLMSLMLTLSKKLDDPEKTPTIEPLISSTRRNHRKLGIDEKVLKLLKIIWFTMIYALEFLIRSLWVKDGKTVLRGGEGVELWPRKVATARFHLDDMKTVKNAVTNAPATHQIINCALGLERALGFDEVRTVVSDSLMIKHPRFCSLLVTDDQGHHYWRLTELDIDRHIILHTDPVGEVGNDEAAINDFLADLAVSSPLSTDKPLWEIHLLSAHKCVVLRLHHALGDGISLMSLMLTLCRKLDDSEQTPTIEPLISSARNPRGLGINEKIFKVLKIIWFTMIYVFEFMMRSLWVKDGRTVVRGGEGVELWPRRVATAKFNLEDMKTVKRAVTNATINDVLFGVISSGLSRYLDKRSPECNRFFFQQVVLRFSFYFYESRFIFKFMLHFYQVNYLSFLALQEGLRITGVALVNLRPSPGLQDIKELMKKNAGSGWGNKFGIMLLPIYYHRNGSNPLDYLKRAKMMIDRKKLSLEAFLSYQIGFFVMNHMGAKFASLLNYRIVCNTSFTVSNVVGPREEITVAGIPVTYIRTSSSSLSHAITMHMVSYAGRADMQILAAKDIIHDPENLAKCFEDALLEMKEAVLRT